ncbi:MAG: hypothetical protein SH857_11365 [Chitinophagales bacterium]|nr:hypothetical protein [Chitinophagales bacterium]
MFYLLLAILCSTCLLLVLKYTGRHGIDTLPVLVVNYIVCCTIGTLNSPEPVSLAHLAEKNWLLPALLLGIVFITVFYMVAVSTQQIGVAITAVAFKLSVVIPVVAAYFLYGDSFSLLKITGIALALAAIFLTSKEDAATIARPKGFLALLPALVFLGSGISDSAFNYLQTTYLAASELNFFLVTLFGTAGVIGFTALTIGSIRKRKLPQAKAIIGGIALGIPNYGSAYFMLLALEHAGVESSALWTINNIGIILLSTAVAAFLFHERINRYGMAGIVLAIFSIVLISAALF